MYRDQEFKLPVVVLEGKVPTLLGRDWLSKIKLKWDELFPMKVHNIEVDSRVSKIKVRYPEVFSGKLGCLKTVSKHGFQCQSMQNLLNQDQFHMP